MKKSLLAVAVAAALPAFAQAQTNVTLYGIADAGVVWQDAGGNGTTTAKSTFAVVSGVQSTSRWGVRGSEDLGGGLSAVFNLEGGYKQDTGTSDASGTPSAIYGTGNGGGLFQRRAVVGLSGKFGQFLLGRDYTPGFSALGNWDMLGYGLFGNSLNFSIGSVGTFTGSAVRWSNALQYISPTMSGFTVRAMYSAGEQAIDPKSRGNAFGISGTYVMGPITAAIFYENEKNAGSPTVDTAKKMGLGGQYNFGQFRVGGGYASTDPDGPTKLTFWNLGAGVKLGAGEVIVQYSSMKESAADAKSNTVGIAYVHPLSKRTNLYATYGTTSNNKASNYVLRASDYTVGGAGADLDPKALGFGIRHQF